MDRYELTPMQEGILADCLSSEGANLYHTQRAFRLERELDPDRLARAWKSVLNRHDACRASIWYETGGVAEQVIHDDVQPDWQVMDCTDRPEQEWDAIVDHALAEDRREGLDITRAPIMRFRLLRMRPDLHFLLWTHHHIMLDGWSSRALLTEVSREYDGTAETDDAPSPEQERLQFGDYVRWLRGQDMEDAEDYWREMFSEPAGPGLGSGATRGVSVASARLEPVELGADTTAKLRWIARDQRVTLSALLYGAWSVVLRTYSGQDVVTFGSVVSGRGGELDGIQDAVGMFINVLPIRVRCSGDRTFSEHARELQSVILDLQQFDFTPLRDIQSWAESDATGVLFESVVSTGGLSSFGVPEGADLFGRSVRSEEPSSYPMMVGLTTTDPVRITVSFDPTLFDSDQVRSIVWAYRHVLESAADGPERPIRELSLLGEVTPAQRDSWRGPRVRVDETPRGVHEYVLDQAERRPEAIAVESAQERVDYAQLRDRVLRVAGELRAAGVDREERIGLCTQRSVDMVVGFLGILAAGGVVIPLDPEYPADRIAHLVGDSGVRRVLAQRATAGTVREFVGDVLWVDDIGPAVGPMDTSVVRPCVPESLAYVAYTSGSTGRPKGTMISHRSIANLVAYLRDDLGLGPGDRVLQSLPLSFDVGICELVEALCLGGTLCLAPTGRYAGDALTDLLRERHVTVASIPVSVLGATETFDLPDLRILLTGGEKLPPEIAKRWAYGRRFVNQYGVSEATVVNLASDCEPDADTVPIGLPIAETTALVLDDNLRPVPPGAPGELYLAGPGLQRGYLGRPGLTAERMVPNPYAETGGDRMYRTGDRVRRRPDGRLDYVGRVDQQLNVRGNRIEPGEVEAALLSDPRVDEAVVLVADGDLRGYVRGPREGDEQAILTRLRSLLPDSMVPVSIHRVPEWPTLPSGKIDREAVPAHARPDEAEAPELIEPRTQVERQLTEVFADVLGVPVVGVNQNFFELGGDSILAIQVVTRAAQHGLSVSTRQVFRHQTVAELAEVTETAAESGTENSVAGTGPAGDPATTDQQAAGGAAGRLSPIQHWFFELDLRRPDEAYQWSRFEISPDIDPQQVETALNEVLRRHDVLRTRFVQQDGAWRTMPPGPFVPVRLRRMRTDDLSEEDETSLVNREIGVLGRSLDLASGELVGCELFERPGVRSHLLMVSHHIAVDGVSWRIIADELDRACRAQLAGEPIDLGPRTTSFDGWLEHLVRYARTDEVRRQRPLWQEIVGTGTGRLPYDHELGPNTEESAATVTVELEEQETRELLRGGADGLGGTTHEALLSTLGQVLTAWSGLDAVQVESENHGREQVTGEVDLSRTVGCFTAAYPLVLDGRDTDSGRAMTELRARLDRIPHNGLGYGLLRYLDPDGAELAHRAQVGFNYLGQWRNTGQGREQGAVRLAGALGTSMSSTVERSYVFDVSAAVVGERLRLHWRYSANLHRPETVRALMDRQVSLLRQLLRARAGEPGRSTTADFPSSGLDQDGIDRVLSIVPDATDIYPLSPLQQGILVHSVIHPGMYCHQFHLRLRGTIDVDALEQAWRSAVARTPALRTAILHERLAEPVQVVTSNPEVPIRHEDWSELAADEFARRLEELTTAEHAAGVDLAAGSPMRLVFVRESADSLVVAITAHHIMVDRWSFDLVLGDLIAHYDALVRERPYTPPARRPYREFIDWLSRQDTEAARSHWTQMLAGVRPCLALPGSEYHSEQQGRFADSDASGTSRFQLKIDERTTDGIRALARRAGVTMNTVLQACWALLLGGAGGGNDVVFGATTSGRPPELSGAQEMVGLFINTLPVRVRMPREQPVVDWLADIQDQQVDSRQYDFAPLYEIQRWAGVTDNRPLFRTMMAFENQPGDSASATENVVQVKTFQRRAGLNYPLALTIDPGRMLLVTLLYDRALLEDDAVVEVGERLRRLLGGLGSEHSTTVGELFDLVAAHDPAPAVEHGPVEHQDSDTDDPNDRTGPDSRAELELMDIWEGVLGERPKDVVTSFYEAGGHSLLALRFADRANKLFGTDVALIELLREPTIRAMARLLTGEESGADRERSLVPIRAEGNRTPLFGVHPGDGRVRCYRRLAQELDEQQPVYGLQDVWASAPSAPWTSLEEMASAYLEQVRSARPVGPYAFVGYSFGGWVAFEMARQLRSAGEQVPMLALVDAAVPDAMVVPEDESGYLAVFLNDLMEGNERLTNLDVSAALRPSADETALQRLVRLVWPDSEEEQVAGMTWLGEAVRLFEREVLLGQSYRPPARYDGPVTLFLASERPDGDGELSVRGDVAEDPTAGWGRFCSDLQVVTLPGTHSRLMTAEALELLADELATRLGDADR